MKLVVSDASAVVEFLLRTPRGEAFEAVVTEADADVHIPAICDVEVASALRRLWLSKSLSVARRDEALSDYLDLTMTRHGHVELLPRIMALAENMSAYDAVYAALAEALEADLVTADERLRRRIVTHTAVTPL